MISGVTLELFKNSHSLAPYLQNGENNMCPKNIYLGNVGCIVASTT